MFCHRHCQITHFRAAEETSRSGKLPWRSSSWSSQSFRVEAWIFTDSTCKFYGWLIYFKVLLTDQNMCNLFHAATESPCRLSRKLPGKPCVSSRVSLAHCHPIASAPGMVAPDLQDWQCPAMARPFPSPWLHY